ncbi:MAG: ribonuclease R [Bacteroidetes bacterium]|nr:MAG: ribonuclease R [Bacteroidota bacterium]
MSKTKKRKPKVKGKKLNAQDLKRQVLHFYRRHPRKQYNPRQVIQKLKMANNKDSVQHAINQLVADKALLERDNYKYQINRDYVFNTKGNDQYVEGKVDTTRSGDAYIVTPEDKDDIFVPLSRLNTAQNGDTVKVRYWTPNGRRKPEGEVVEVLQRSAEQFVGILHVFSRLAVVTVEGRNQIDIAVPLDKLKGGENGQLVTVKVVDWSAKKFDAPVGEIVAVLGQPGTSALEMQAILINNGFDIEFPQEVIEFANMLPASIGPQEIEGRRDFRQVRTFTIDPEDAKDFDDALSLEMFEDGSFEVGVHIADVTHYVKPGTPLDQEAYQRATSVYLVDRVCPMLPERLSNELCSLRPHEDKLTFSAAFVFDKNFRIRKRWFGKAVIHSDRRFTYEEAQAILDSGQGDFAEELSLLNRVAEKLRKQRFKTGSIDFDSEEVRFRLDEDGTPLEVYVKERKAANMLIEDFMLLANREVATFMSKKEQKKNTTIPFVYRVHDDPDLDKAAELAAFARALGFEMDVTTPEMVAKSYNRLIKAAEKNPALQMLAPLAIRTMAKAIYSIENVGHYGLGFSHYTHFTSPIRRYSDVLVHRLLELNLAKDQLFITSASKLAEQCRHISDQERKAAEAERESIKYKQVEFMKKHVGETFQAKVNGIADFGIFVEVIESRCEGMISFQYMDQPYEIGEGRLSVRGRRDGKIIRMGDELMVKVIDTDLKRRRIEMAYVEGPVQTEEAVFIPAEDKSDERSNRRRGGKGRSRAKSAQAPKTKGKPRRRTRKKKE